jgi:hypothetical protein
MDLIDASGFPGGGSGAMLRPELPSFSCLLQRGLRGCRSKLDHEDVSRGWAAHPHPGGHSYLLREPKGAAGAAERVPQTPVRRCADQDRRWAFHGFGSVPISRGLIRFSYKRPSLQRHPIQSAGHALSSLGAVGYAPRQARCCQLLIQR